MHLTNTGRPGTVSAISTKSQYMDQIIMKATETELHHNHINRENGLAFSRSQKPLIHSLIEYKNPCHDDIKL
jgi:hypothetical protein